LTIKEIAEKANVSLATVSMVVNSKPGISKKTQDRILRIIRENGYSTPLVKNDLKKIGNIQLMIYKNRSEEYSEMPFLQQLIEGIELKSKQNGYNLAIKYIYANSHDFSDFKIEINDPDINGLLLLATEMDIFTLKKFLELRIPLVVVDAYFLDIPAEYVVVNNLSGGYIATKHLLKAGHREVGYLKSSFEIQNFKGRFEGYMKALVEFGITPNKSYTVFVHEFQNTNGHNAEIIQFGRERI